MLEAPRRLSLKLRAEIEVEDAAASTRNACWRSSKASWLLADALTDRYFIQATEVAPTDEPSGLA